jgi:beta-lactamase superfamily II metal-dependent hydrolase
MTIYLLDMGLKQYGDCILITNGERKILIDYGKPNDQSSLRLQLKKILKQDPPFNFDLLVVTHCHDDHIGSLPEMIETEEITADTYLLADPAMRWGNKDGTDAVVVRDGLTEALMEEDHSDLSDAELEEFISDAGLIDVRYKRMISVLKKRKANVELFKGVDGKNYDFLNKEFSDFGLQILGPTKKHLKITREVLVDGKDAIADFISKSEYVDSAQNHVDIYRKIWKVNTIDDNVFLDVAKKDSGSINDQSIVIKVSADDCTALLGGDMQFADPKCTGIEEEVEALIEKVFENGPYDLVKTSHHSSDNGINGSMLDRFIEGGTEFFAHSGGLKDDDHPDQQVLDLLKKRKDKIQFARTDRNGVIKVEKDSKGVLTMYITKGTFNNFTANVLSDANESGQEQVNSERPVRTVTSNISNTTQDSFGNVEVTAKIPKDLSKVTITVDIEPEKKKI